MSEARQNSRIERLHKEIVGCRLCGRLVEWRERVARERRAAFRDQEYWGRPVPGFGDVRARLVLVGLAPAAHGANRTGRIFTGDRSGDWLYRALHRGGFASQPTATDLDDGLRLSDAYVTSAVRCAPPGNRPLPEESAACQPYLERELRLLDRARVLIALGGVAYRAVAALEGIRPRPRFGHGVEVEVAGGRTVICSYHPSQQNTFTGRLTEPMLDSVIERARTLIAAAG